MQKEIQNIFEGSLYSVKDNTIFIREFNTGDLVRVYEIEYISFKDPYHPTFLLNLYELYHETFFVALENERIAGYVISRIVGSSGHVIAIAVDPIKRKKGIGKILMSATINRLCEFGANNVWLEVRISNNDAIEFYKKLGFAEEGIIPAYYSDFEDARMLKKIL